MSAQTNREKCPLCSEEMDLTDKELKPCKCGYELCLWCWHHIMEMDHKDESGGRCPGCRSIYNKDRIMGTSGSNKILKELCADKSNLQKEQNKSHKLKSSNVQFALAEESKDLKNVRVIQRKLVYIVGMPSEFANPKVLKQKDFLGQYGKIENIVVDNVGANHQSPDSGRAYVTFSREEEAARCIQAVNGYILDGRPLKATIGVTRYCHVWLSNRTCWKENCSYVHYKAAAEDICSKDDVSVFCLRIQQLMGIDTKCFQHRSGSTLPPPVHCNSRATISSGILKDICTNDDRSLSSDAAKKLDLLPATTPRDLSLSSGSQKEHINEQLSSNNDKSQASVQLGNGTSNSMQNISAENQASDISFQKPQYISAASQGQGGSIRRFTVLTSPGASTDIEPKATGQVVNATSNSTKLTLIKNESDSIAIPKSQNVNLVSQKPERSSHLWASKRVQSHALAEKKNESSDISAKPVPGNQKQPSKNSVSISSTAVHSTSGRPMLSNLSMCSVKSQVAARPHNLSGSDGKLASQNQLQLVNQQNAHVSNTGIAKASLGRNVLNNQVPSTDSKHQNSAQGQGGSHCLYNKEITRFDHSSHTVPLSKPPSEVSSTDVVAPNGKGRKKQVRCPPGFEKLQNSSDSGKFVPLISSTCSGPCSTTDASVQDSCDIADQPHIISMVSHCLDDGDVAQNKNVNISSPPSSTDTIWGRAQFPDIYFSGLSNHTHVSPYPSGFLQCAPPVSCPSYQQPSYLDGTTGCYLSTGGYGSFYQSTASGMAAGMVGTLLQQPPMPSPRDGWTRGNADSGLNCPQIDISYPRGYTLF